MTSPCRCHVSPSSSRARMRPSRRPIRPSGRAASGIWATAICTTIRYARPDWTYERFAAETASINRIVHDIVVSVGGSISAEHGIGRLRLEENLRYKDPIEMDLMVRMKRALDPLNIMNPGRVVPREINGPPRRAWTAQSRLPPMAAMPAVPAMMPVTAVAPPMTAIGNPDLTAVTMTAMPIAATCPVGLLDGATGGRIGFHIAKRATSRSGLSRAGKQSDRYSHGGPGKEGQTSH